MRSLHFIFTAGLLCCAGTLLPIPSVRGQDYDSNFDYQWQQQQPPKRLPVVDRSGVPATMVSDSSIPQVPEPSGNPDNPPLPPYTVTDISMTDPQAAPPAEDTYTLDEIKAEMKKLLWKKGDFTITPYGILWGNMVYESERSTYGDYTMYVNSPQDINGSYGDPTFHVDGRNTRLGIDVLGPKIGCWNCAQTGGKVEVDFQNSPTGLENKGALLLRHAYVEAKNEEFRLLAGQTWDVVSPLFPTSVLYSVYWDAGNIGYRRAQFRGERYLAFSDTMLLTLQGSINGNVIADTAPAGAFLDQTGWPVIEGRAALTFGPRGKGDLPVTMGVSSHVGEQRCSFTTIPAAHNLSARTWSLNGDLKMPFNECWGVQGEVFMGENLSAFLGGIGQGYNFTQRESIYSRGGWIELYHYITPQWHSHVGYCIDDPLDREIPTGGRTYNQAIFGNLIYDVTKQFSLGLEVGSWRTLYQGLEAGESIRTEFMAKYGF
jgi:hypothetical protein